MNELITIQNELSRYMSRNKMIKKYIIFKLFIKRFFVLFDKLKSYKINWELIFGPNSNAHVFILN